MMYVHFNNLFAQFLNEQDCQDSPGNHDFPAESLFEAYPLPLPYTAENFAGNSVIVQLPVVTTVFLCFFLYSRIYRSCIPVFGLSQQVRGKR